MDGRPDPDATRRVRVQARQVFCFAKAIEMRWSGADTAKTIVENGLDYINTRLRHPDGGFVHLINPDGRVIDPRRDLYDHAFMILAGSAAYKAIGSPLGLEIADNAIAYIDTHLKDDLHGGWFESSERELPRRANPHMHLLEAMMEYYGATRSDAALAHMTELVALFEAKFFIPQADILAEYFGEDWRIDTEHDQTIFEPGHHYEWASLLRYHEFLTGRDTASWQRRLITCADQHGMNPSTGFVTNTLNKAGHKVDANSRLWHQLERCRAYYLFPELRSRSVFESELDKVFQSYLNAGPSGGWIDELGDDGVACSITVPASMLYHAVTCFEPLLLRDSTLME